MGMSLSGQTMAAAGTTDEVYALPDVVVLLQERNNRLPKFLPV